MHQFRMEKTKRTGNILLYETREGFKEHKVALVISDFNKDYDDTNHGWDNKKYARVFSVAPLLKHLLSRFRDEHDNDDSDRELILKSIIQCSKYMDGEIEELDSNGYIV